MCNISRGSADDYTGILQNYEVLVIPGNVPGESRARDMDAQKETASAAAAAPETLSAVISEKAVDEMRKDKVLQQYQYFVGSPLNPYTAEDADGTAVQKV